MRFKVELRKEAVWFIKHACNAAERAAFYEELERQKGDPLSNSVPAYDPTIRKYMLRCFPFGSCLAVFEINAAKETLIVRTCKRRRPPPSVITPGGEAPEVPAP